MKSGQSEIYEIKVLADGQIKARRHDRQPMTGQDWVAVGRWVKDTPDPKTEQPGAAGQIDFKRAIAAWAAIGHDITAERISEHWDEIKRWAGADGSNGDRTRGAHE